jgi:hypothetical protein
MDKLAALIEAAENFEQYIDIVIDQSTVLNMTAFNTRRLKKYLNELTVAIGKAKGEAHV